MNSYIRSHDLPIKLFTRSGQLYLMRTDSNEQGEVTAINIDDYNRTK